MGQKIITSLRDKSKEDAVKITLYLFIAKLLNLLQEFDLQSPKNYN